MSDACDTLAMQLAELEMLVSMFSKAGELVFDDPSALIDLRSLVDGQLLQEDEALRQRICFTLNLLTDKEVNVWC